MLEALPYAVMAVVHLMVLGGLVALLVRDRSPFTLVAAAVALGLVHDNVMLAVGDAIGAGDLLRALSLPRFWVHGLLTPALMVVALSWARGLGVSWARSRAAWAVLGTLTAVLVVRGVWNDVLHLELELTDEDGLLRYTYVDPAHGIVSPVITVVVLLVIGTAMQRQAQWPWLLVGSIVMFVASGGGASVPYVANMGESVLDVTMLLTAREAWRRTLAREADAPEREPQTAG